jgi:glycosyltransferase involved in cell wall biosynthesis
MSQRNGQDADADAERMRVVILNQYYVPDVASTGYLLSELAAYLAGTGAEVSVITCQPSYGPPETWRACPRFAIEQGIRVTRMWTTRFSKDSIVGRTCNSLTFLVQLAIRLLFRRNRGEVFLYTTNPPYLGMIGAFVRSFRRHSYAVLLHDSYPQLAVWVGKIGAGGIIDRLWHRLNHVIYHRAEQTIVLCAAAKRLVCDRYGVDPERVHIIPNWADGEKLFPVEKADSEIAHANELVEPFTLLYSGNLGLYYDFETILDAAERLKDENFRLVLVGSGGKKEWIAREIKRRDLRNTLLLGYQPFEQLNASLNACDASLVTIARDIEGISFPSKLYSSLAVGKPIIALSEADSELRGLVDKYRVGYWFEVGDDGRLTDCLRDMMANPDRNREQGRNARRLFEERYTIEAAGHRYAGVLGLVNPKPDRGAPAA